ncbi:MAG: YfcE family phosphodiesterase [Candidatus Omnitrophica bacterium]|nr:YfcE family phosphodiesterase [Candidatus Omnitrophota bacterium]MCF7893835.1 YfcE family phosphodiesterase [Candidatus Omnitrophota bacterium]
MRILVISDTHITKPNKNFFSQLDKEIEISDCCIHAGDFTAYSVYKSLSKRIKTYAVAGNMDDDQIIRNLPQKTIFKLSGFTFALAHGAGTPNTIKQYIEYQFQKNFEKIDIFIYGHSHQAINHKLDNKIYFNPGSVGDTITTPEKTYGIIEIKNGKLNRGIKKIG